MGIKEYIDARGLGRARNNFDLPFELSGIKLKSNHLAERYRGCVMRNVALSGVNPKVFPWHNKTFRAIIQISALFTSLFCIPARSNA